MLDGEIIDVPTGFLIPAADYGSFRAALSAVKSIKEILKDGEIGAISMQLDRNIQPLLDETLLKKELLPPVSEGAPLIVKKDGEFAIRSRKDMAFLFLVVNYAWKKGMPCFANEDYTKNGDKRLNSCIFRLYNFYNLHGNIAHICTRVQAEHLETRFLARSA